MDKNEFVMQVFEIAFGDDALEKDYSYEDVINQLLEFSNDALKYEEQEGLR